MNFVYVGKLVNTHGIKGEVRILSDFEKKNLVFKKDFNLYLGKIKNKFTINSYRVHKNYDMVTFNNINNINDIENYKGVSVYIKREDLNLMSEEFLYNDLVGLEIFENGVLVGKISDYVYNKNHILLQISGEKDFYIPYVSEYIEKVDIKNNKIYVKNTKGLII